MDTTEIGRAEAHAVARIEASGDEVESIRVVQKSRESYLATVSLKGRDGERQMIVTRAQLDA